MLNMEEAGSSKNGNLTNSMEMSPTSKAASHSVSQEFPNILWNPKARSQEPSTGPHPEKDQSSLYHSILSLQGPPTYV
jgi:hypothetical protein